MRLGGGKSRKGQPRRRVTPWWRQGAAKGVAVAVGLLAGGGPALLAWQSGMVEAAAVKARWTVIAASARAGFTVREILVSGRQETDPGALLEALRLQRGAPILAFDPEAARTRLEELPWVRRAAVARRLPDTVFLMVEERTPFALWQREGRFAVIDREGVVILDDNAGRFARLPLVVGDDAPAHAAALLDLLAGQPELEARVAAAVRVGRRRWNLRLDNGIDVRLPEEQPAQALARLAEYARSNGLLEREVEVLDFRMPDRLVVKRADGPKPGPRGPGRDT
jgi:cell division protein FtsQ